MLAMLRQSVYGHLPSYEDVNLGEGPVGAAVYGGQTPVAALSSTKLGQIWRSEQGIFVRIAARF